MSNDIQISHEQIVALKVLRDEPYIEASDLCNRADCSWGELFALHSMGLIDAGFDRVEAGSCHPTIPEEFKEIVNQIIE